LQLLEDVEFPRVRDYTVIAFSDCLQICIFDLAFELILRCND